MITVCGSGGVEFRVHLPEARRVLLAGDFTGWRAGAIEMERSEDGWWTAEVALPAGDHNFQYVVDEATWIPDYSAHGLWRNRYGTWVSHLRVEAATGANPLPFPERTISRLAA